LFWGKDCVLCEDGGVDTTTAAGGLKPLFMRSHYRVSGVGCRPRSYRSHFSITLQHPAGTQTIVAFTFLSLVHPVSYAVANVAKRVVVIGCSMIFLGETGSMYNLMGMATTMSGIAMYRNLKIDSKLADDAKGKSVLPVHVQQTESWL
jgi:hypothetical protein